MNYEEIKKLIEDMGNSKLEALDIEFPEGIKISMKKNQQSVSMVPTCVNSNMPVSTENLSKELVVVKKEEGKLVTSPMVGTFYRSSSPKEEPFVKVGDHVKVGDVLCVIEAMKLMNEVESTQEGEIVEILVENEEVVDFGKPLFRIK